jgi:pyruvate dehydrogenase E1 component alpha subunit
MNRLDTSTRAALLRDMVMLRRFEERCAQLYQETRIRGFLHLYVGEEAVAAGAGHVLLPQDNAVGTYREHGHALMKGVTAGAVMAEMFGRVDGCSGGRGGSMHLFDVEHRFYGGNAIVGGGLPIAVGLALADRLTGRQAVTACYFGEGAVAEGEFHECMNLASLWDLPVLFCCENNLYAMGTALERSEAVTDLALRASGYGMPAWPVDGMDVEAVVGVTDHASAYVRGGGGPAFVEYRTYRFRAHSMYDPELYRDKEEVAAWRSRDPIQILLERMNADCEADQGTLETITAEVDEEIERAVEFADASPLEDVADLLRHVYAEPMGVTT